MNNNWNKISSERKQRLYEKFLECRNERNEYEYKNYKWQFETIKKRSKNFTFLNWYKDNLKRTGPWLKKLFGKKKYNKTSLKNCIGNKEITDSKTIAKSFNNFFIEIGPNLAKDIDPLSVTFDKCLKTFTANQPEHNLTVNEMKDEFFSLNLIKVRSMIKSISMLLKHVLDLCISFIFLTSSCKSGVLPDKLKIAGLHPCLR